MRRALALVLAALLAGCARPEEAPPATATVEPPPDGGGWRDCPPAASRTLAVPFRARATEDAGDLPAGLHRLDADTFLWVYASYAETLREDRVTRVNDVTVARDGAGVVHACTRVDLATPLEVDATPRSYDVAVLLSATQGMPTGPVRWTVNWAAGCPCSPPPRGNTTADFP